MSYLEDIRKITLANIATKEYDFDDDDIQEHIDKVKDDINTNALLGKSQMWVFLHLKPEDDHRHFDLMPRIVFYFRSLDFKVTLNRYDKCQISWCYDE